MARSGGALTASTNTLFHRTVVVLAVVEQLELFDDLADRDHKVSLRDRKQACATQVVDLYLDPASAVDLADRRTGQRHHMSGLGP